jgi:hypothetical protein
MSDSGRPSESAARSRCAGLCDQRTPRARRRPAGPASASLRRSRILLAVVCAVLVGVVAPVAGAGTTPFVALAHVYDPSGASRDHAQGPAATDTMATAASTVEGVAIAARRNGTEPRDVRSLTPPFATEAGDGLFAPGPHAGESIPAANGPSRAFTPAERAEINRIGAETGCHRCGVTDPGTKSGNFVPDHQPPNAINPPGGPQDLHPHCIQCSREQGLTIARQKK